MSGEHLSAKDLNKISSEATFSKSIKSKININDLLHKVREEKTKERKENYMFLGLVVGLLTVTGIIASL
jgi:protoporphyrinogen oxidase